MSGDPRRTRVTYDYITAHRNFWTEHAAPELTTVIRLASQMSLQCRDTYFFGKFHEVHDGLINFVRDRADEGHKAFYDFSARLAEIKAHYEAHESFHRQLMQSGGLRP
ncbi:MAG TPA: hypothetical protein VFC00_37045 [Micromonosporaceae bacterium]|nr:hypothetical protein [Micromonosporaceae bacterium]